MTNKNIEQKEFNNLINLIGSEIEHSGVKVVVAANAQMLLHYWRVGYIISYFQYQLGWGGKVINKISQHLRMKYPEKKGYSTRNLQYMCQFAKQYNADIIKRIAEIDSITTFVSVDEITNSVRLINEIEFAQEPLAQIAINSQKVDNIISDNLPFLITQELPAQIESSLVSSPMVTINWALHVVLMTANYL